MKHVGLNVAADPLFTASYTGVNGGLVIFVADDPGMHSSQNEQDTRIIARGAKVPVIEPSDSEECNNFTKEAFKISEEFDAPVIVRLTTRIPPRIVDYRTENRIKAYVKIRQICNDAAMARRRHVSVEERMAKLENTRKLFTEQNQWRQEIGVITAGIAYQYAREAFGMCHI